jgi:hypothetical protein
LSKILGSSPSLDPFSEDLTYGRRNITNYISAPTYALNQGTFQNAPVSHDNDASNKVRTLSDWRALKIGDESENIKDI